MGNRGRPRKAAGEGRGKIAGQRDPLSSSNVEASVLGKEPMVEMGEVNPSLEGSGVGVVRDQLAVEPT
ncbi:hypothetical protein Dimus_007762, partial [Dionaea muscipula]